MKIKKACAIFTEIESDEFGDLEKLYAIKEVLNMETHNGISKEEILDAFKWIFNLAVELSEYENATRADRIRGMKDEEMAEFLCKVKSDYQWADHEFPSEEEYGEWVAWLQSKEEEEKNVRVVPRSEALDRMMTQKDDCGNWKVNGFSWDNLREGHVITKEDREKLYGCLCKLKDYESTGLSTDQVESLVSESKN